MVAMARTLLLVLGLFFLQESEAMTRIHLHTGKPHADEAAQAGGHAVADVNISTVELGGIASLDAALSHIIGQVRGLRGRGRATGAAAKRGGGAARRIRGGQLRSGGAGDEYAALDDAVGVIDELAEEMLKKIEATHAEQQALLDQTCRQVQSCGSALTARWSQAEAKKSFFDSAQYHHQTCRSSEASAADEVRECGTLKATTLQLEETACRALKEFEAAQGNQAIHTQVATKAEGESVKDYLQRMASFYCGAGGEGHSGGGQCNGLMCQWRAKDRECSAAQASVAELEARCSALDTAYATQKAACSSKQAQMDKNACERAVIEKTACEAYHSCHNTSASSYLTLKASAEKGERGRKAEWRALRRMRCMMDVLGADVKNPDENQLEACKAEEQYNTSHLNLTYECNTEERACAATDLYPGSEAYAVMLRGLPSGAPAAEPQACEGMALHAQLALESGLVEDVYYTSSHGCDFPDLSGKIPAHTRSAASVHFGSEAAWPGLAQHDNFAVRYTGYIIISAPGEYTFWTASDEGSRLLLNDFKVVDNAGCHGKEESSGKARLEAGPAKLALDFFERSGGAYLALYYSGPDTGGNKVAVPEAVLKRGTAPHVPVARAPPTGTCTCGLTIHNYVWAVYVDGVDKTLSVSGDLNNWGQRKEIKFPCGPSTLLAVEGADAESGCNTGGFAARCTSTDASSPWNEYIADTTWKVHSADCVGGGCSATNRNLVGGRPEGWFLPSFDDSQWQHAVKGNTDYAQGPVGTPWDICGANGRGFLFRSNVQAER